MENSTTTQESKIHHHKPAHPPISLEEALERGKRWSDVLGELKYFQGSYARYKPKALFIPYEDLKELIEHHEKHHKHVGGVRIYFGLVPSPLTIDPTPVSFDLRGSIVAVGKDGKDIIAAPGDENAEGIGEIYDFTAPCPDVCDVTSRLFP